MESPSKLAVFILMIFICEMVYGQSQPQAEWGYKGNIAPERWGQLDPSFATCASGKSQSPIDIPENVIKIKIPLKLTYQATPFSITNTGRTVQVKFPASVNQSLTFNGQLFRLIALHVHAPSEHLWQGRDFPLEIHLVHQNNQGKLLYVAIFGKGGEENPELAKVIANIPKEIGKEVQVPLIRFNPEGVLPSNRAYYAFMGSITVPPCYEGVQWIVFAEPITVSPAQIVEFKQAFGGVNARPVQPLNGRKIFYSTQRKIRYNYAAL